MRLMYDIELMRPIKTTILFLALITLCNCSNQKSNLDILLSYLPESVETGEWERAGAPDLYVGDDLFLLINGGAEIYHEYGFKQVVAAEYKKNDQYINVELYEMQSPGAAYGMFTFKTGDRGTQIKLGNEGLLEAYFLNFWKGSLLVTLTGFDSTAQTIAGLRAIAAHIDESITLKGATPVLAKLFSDEKVNARKTIYIRGNLALYNNYVFDTENIFGVREGVVGKLRDGLLFVFQYADSAECEKWYTHAIEQLRRNEKFTDFVIKDTRAAMKDRNGKAVIVQPHGKYLLISVGMDVLQIRRYFTNIITNLDT